MHEITAKVDFESSLQHTVIIMLIFVVVCIDILVSIFLLYLI